MYKQRLEEGEEISQADYLREGMFQAEDTTRATVLR
jgi:hypothetical protein